MTVNSYKTAQKTRNESFSSSQYKAFSIYRGHLFNGTPKGHIIARLSGRQVQNLKFVLPYYGRIVCNNVIYWTAIYRESTVSIVWWMPGTKQKYSLTAKNTIFNISFIEYHMEPQYLQCLLYVVQYMHRHAAPILHWCRPTPVPTTAYICI